MQQPEFLGGVVEGFYGRPWSTTERLQLFAQISALGMNTYFYAPKDDLKHRAIWRQLYDTSEIESFRELGVRSRVVGVMVGGEDLRHARSHLRDTAQHRRRLRRVDHGGLAALFAHQQIGVVVAQRGDPLDPQAHGAAS